MQTVIENDINKMKCPLVEEWSWGSDKFVDIKEAEEHVLFS